MKDGFRRSSGTLRFAHLAVMAFVLMLGVAGQAISADNNLLHNSNRFACSDGAYQNQTDCTTNGGTWNPNRRYTGGWGTATGLYGEFTCNTCHAKGSGNIKRITQTVTTPSGTIPGSAQTVTLSSAVDGSANFDETAGNHAASNKICEVCHTYNAADPALASPTGGVRYHGYNMAGAAAANQTHQIDSDCIKCHQHNLGFRASCTSCHGNPPLVATDLTATLDPANSTGSTTAGKHQLHAVNNAYACNTCHTGWEGSGQMPNSGNINIGFDAFGVTTGTYNGRTAGIYTGAFTNTNTLTCATVYCHGSATPAWNDTLGGAECGTCHGDATGAPTETAGDGDLAGATIGTKVGKHVKHVALYACAICHSGATHVDGTNDIAFSGAAVGTTYTKATATCSTVACHTGADYIWNTTSPALSCTSCHLAPPVSGAHGTHYTAKNSWTSPDASGATCDNCHPDNRVTHSNMTDGIIGVDAALVWNGTTCSTTTTGCHNGLVTPAWTSTGITCAACHTAGGTNSATVANPVSGLHNISAANVTGGVTKHDSTLGGGCEACHTKTAITGHWDGVASAATPNYTAAQVGITAMTGGSYTDAGGVLASRGTCATTCHSDSGNWSRLWSTDANSLITTVGSPRCNVCHGQWTTWVAGTTHYKAGGTNSAANSQGSGHDSPATCDNCHVYASGSARHDSATHRIDVNSNSTLYARTNNTYGSGTAGCSQCHSATAAGYNFPISTFASNAVSGTAIPMPACSSCHDSAVAASKGAPAVDATSSHISITRGAVFGACENCHSGHSGGVIIANNPTVGINYSTTGHTGINLGGPGTNALISGKTTEAEICWACHTADGINEFGLNTDTNGAAANYNYGTLSNNAASAGGWYSNISVGSEAGATWTSAVGAFSYKTSAIKSTHSANAAGTAVVSGIAYSVGGMNETLDAVANIRCSYCHDVHDLNRLAGDASTGKPWLRGTWKGNPYKEDGAPQLSHAGSWTTQGVYNQVPRASASTTNNGGVGGYWIDQNSGNPNNGETLATTAGLCVICHTSSVDTMDYTLSENIWVGTNGHSAAVIGGTGSAAVNIFTYAARGGAVAPSTNTSANTRNVQMGRAAETNRGYTYRGNGDGGYGYWPQLVGSRPYAFQNYAWGANADNGTAPTISAGTTALPFDTTSATPVANYHTFNCGKCHNPHASRLPKLMITNCLDTNHNTWQDNASAILDATTGNRPSGYNTAQNCHRRAPAEAPGETGSGTTYGAGWNKVTPW